MHKYFRLPKTRNRLCSKKEEFSRDDPESYKKYYWLRALNYIVPMLIVIIGLFVTTQKFAPMMNYDPSVIGRPLFVFKSGYRLYNPMIFILGMFKFALSETYSYYFFQAAPPAIFSLILALFLFLIASVILNSHQKNQRHSRNGTLGDNKGSSRPWPPAKVWGCLRRAGERRCVL